MNLYNQQKIIKNKLGLLNLAQELVKYLAIAEIVFSKRARPISSKQSEAKRKIDLKNFMTNMEKRV